MPWPFQTLPGGDFQHRALRVQDGPNTKYHLEQRASRRKGGARVDECFHPDVDLTAETETDTETESETGRRTGTETETETETEAESEARPES